MCNSGLVGNAGCSVVVDSDGDPLAPRVAEELEARGRTVRSLAARQLAQAPLALTASEARLDGVPVRGLFFGAQPSLSFSDGFAAQDASFSSHEAGASWLAVMGLPQLSCVNRLDAELWYTSAQWAVWRRRLHAMGVPLAPLAVGGVADREEMWWLPWAGGIASPPGVEAQRCFATALVRHTGARPAVWCCGAWVSGDPQPSAHEAVDALAEHGVGLLEVIAGPEGVVTCSAYPRLDEDAAAIAARRIAEALD